MLIARSCLLRRAASPSASSAALTAARGDCPCRSSAAPHEDSAPVSALYLVLATVALAAGCQRPAPSGELGKAAAAGDRVRLAALLRKTAADTPEDAWGALVWASRAGQVEAVALLLDAGADPNRPDRRQGWTPLMHALHTHQVAVARLLLARGADPRIGSAGTSPVVMATLDNESALVRSMLTAGLPRDQRQRALDEAIGGGALADIDRSLTGTCRTETARELLQHDPALAVDGSGAFFTPLWWARRQGCLETVRLVTGRTAVARR